MSDSVLCDNLPTVLPCFLLSIFLIDQEWRQAKYVDLLKAIETHLTFWQVQEFSLKDRRHETRLYYFLVVHVSGEWVIAKDITKAFALIVMSEMTRPTQSASEKPDALHATLLVFGAQVFSSL